MDFIEKYVNAGSTSISNILLHHYHQIGMSTSELMVYLELRSYIDRGQGDPAVKQIADHLGTSEDQVYDLINQMVKDHLMIQKMQKSADGKESLVYDFSPLIHKLVRLVENGEDAQQQKETQNARQKLFTMLETEFGRMLNPIEMSLVNDWIDQDNYNIEVIKLALRETVLNGKYNFKYMDRILSNWDRQNLKTPQAVQAALRQFDERHHYTSQQDKSAPQPSGHQIPIFKLDSLDDQKHKGN